MGKHLIEVPNTCKFTQENHFYQTNIEHLDINIHVFEIRWSVLINFKIIWTNI